MCGRENFRHRHRRSDKPDVVLPLVYLAGTQVDTPLTPNANARARATYDLNDTTFVDFYYQDRILYWAALVSIATVSVTLDKDIGNSVVTFCKGLTVQFKAQGVNRYTVFLDGDIVDSKSKYRMVGKSLGVFERSASVRRRLAGARASG